MPFKKVGRFSVLKKGYILGSCIFFHSKKSLILIRTSLLYKWKVISNGSLENPSFSYAIAVNFLHCGMILENNRDLQR